MIGEEEQLHLVGEAPDSLAGCRVEDKGPLLQMVCSAGSSEPEGADEVRELSASDVPAMLALTKLVFPGFFRTRTHELGRYLGIHQNGQLVAMAGERLFAGTYREISAVCTHPDFLGRGYARRLVSLLVQAHLAAGLTSFLHVIPTNERARAVYERVGFRDRGLIRMVAIQKPTSPPR